MNSILLILLIAAVLVALYFYLSASNRRTQVRDLEEDCKQLRATLSDKNQELSDLKPKQKNKDKV